MDVMIYEEAMPTPVFTFPGNQDDQTGNRQRNKLIMNILKKRLKPLKKIGIDKMYKCDQCNKVFSFSSKLHQHKHLCHGAQKYRTCTKCGKTGLLNQAYGRHFSYCRTKKHSCDKCGVGFLSIEQLQTHKVTDNCKVETNIVQNTEKQPKNRINLKKSKLRINVGSISNEGKIDTVCHRCDKTFMDLSLLKRHYRFNLRCLESYKVVSSDAWAENITRAFYSGVCQFGQLEFTAYRCDICEKLFPYSLRAELHLNKKHSAKKNTPKPVKLPRIRKRGIKSSKDKSCTCSHCGALLPSKQALYHHTRALHIIYHRRPRFDCAICHEKNLGRIKIRIHEMMHSGKEKSHKCGQCGKKYFLKNQLTFHVRTNHRTPHKCDRCNKSFKNEQTLRYHMECHSSTYYQCNVCEKKFIHKNAYSRHLRRHYDSMDGLERIIIKPKSWVDNLTSRWICGHCDENCVDETTLNNHLSSHVSNNSYVKCVECYKWFGDMEALKEHKRHHQMSCSYCFKNFHTASSLGQHFRTHAGKKPHRCRTCSKGFKTEHTLRHHEQNVHSKNTPFKCVVCSREFSLRGSLSVHMLKHREYSSRILRTKVYKCYFCKERFKDNGTCTTHMRTHSLFDEQNCCEICSRYFKSKHNLVKHRFQKHSVQSEQLETDFHKCELCARVYNSERTLRLHKEKIHKKKPSWMVWTCHLCNRQFDFLRDMLTHTRSLHWQSVKCDRCKMTFATIGKLKEHKLKVHQNAPTIFSCKFCNKKFLYATYLRTHTRAMHSSNNPLCCFTCDKRFTKMSRFRQHMRLRHSVEIKPEYNQSDEQNVREIGDVKLEIQVQCEKCFLILTSPDELENHMRQAHTKNEWETFIRGSLENDEAEMSMFLDAHDIKEEVELNDGTTATDAETEPAEYHDENSSDMVFKDEIPQWTDSFEMDENYINIEMRNSFSAIEGMSDLSRAGFMRGAKMSA